MLFDFLVEIQSIIKIPVISKDIRRGRNRSFSSGINAGSFPLHSLRHPQISAEGTLELEPSENLPFSKHMRGYAIFPTGVPEVGYPLERSPTKIVLIQIILLRNASVWTADHHTPHKAGRCVQPCGRGALSHFGIDHSKIRLCSYLEISKKRPCDIHAHGQLLGTCIPDDSVTLVVADREGIVHILWTAIN